MKMNLTLLSAGAIALVAISTSFAQQGSPGASDHEELNRLKVEVARLRENLANVPPSRHYSQTSQVVGNATFIWILDEQTGDMRLCFNMSPTRDVIACGRGAQ